MIAANTDAVLTKARSQIGVNESPAYSNRTPYTAWYGMTGPWCAMFVSWVFWHAGYPLPPIRTRKGFAYCPDIVNWAKANGTWRPSSSNYVPKRGDIVLFDFIGRPSHVGIVDHMLADGRVRTVEGNTNAAGSRTGGSVMSHSRNRRGSTIGYVEVRNLRPAADAPAGGRSYRLGDSGPPVEFLQGLLNKAWKYRITDAGRTGGAQITVDGRFGAQTQTAVRELQRFINRDLFKQGKTVGIPEDGVADPATQYLLAAAVGKA